MRIAITVGIAIVLIKSHATLFSWPQSAPPRLAMTVGKRPGGQSAIARGKSYRVYFPDVAVPKDAGIGVVRLVLTCAHVVAITRIPDDWYVQTLRPNVQSGPEWTEFQFASNAVEFAAGHGVTRLPSLRSLDGAITVTIEDEGCLECSGQAGKAVLVLQSGAENQLIHGVGGAPDTSVRGR